MRPGTGEVITSRRVFREQKESMDLRYDAWNITGAQRIVSLRGKLSGVELGSDKANYLRNITLH